MKERIRVVRKTLKITVQEFSEKLGYSKSSIEKMESGKSKIEPRFITLLSSVFDVNEEWFRSGEGEIFSPRKGQDFGFPSNSLEEKLCKALYEMTENERNLVWDIFQTIKGKVNMFL